MTIFHQTREFTYSKPIAAPAADVISFIQDPLKLCSQSPLFISLAPDTSTTEPNWYIITERLVIVGPIETTTTFRARLVPVEGGVTSQVEADLGVRLNAHYSVVGLGANSSTLNEVTTVTASALLMPIVFPTMRDAHIAVIENIATKAASPGGLNGLD